MIWIRRFMQSIVLIALCILLAVVLNAIYIGVAIAAASLALATGVTIVMAIGLAIVWPVLALSFVLHITKESRAKATATSAHEAALPSVEDSKHREN